MANILARRRTGAVTIERAKDGWTWDGYQAALQAFLEGTGAYTLTGGAEPTSSFLSHVQSVYESSNVVSAAIVTRALLLQQTRFAFRNLIRSSPDYRQLSGGPTLAKLERPDPGTLTRPEMLATMELHASLAGSAFLLDHGDRLEVARPDLMKVILMGADDAALVQRGRARKAGYLYFPDGYERPETQEAWPVEKVVHWAPERHPTQWWTGASWVSTVLREVTADKAATRYLNAFFVNGATPYTIMKPGELMTPDEVRGWREMFNEKHQGARNAFKTMWLGGGIDVQVVGSNIADLDLKGLQGGLETRIAARSRVPAVILGIREGSQGSGLQSGFYQSARRMLADGWYTPTTQNLCAALETVVPPAPGFELAADASDVLFLQDDELDAAEVMAKNAAALQALDAAGYDGDAAVKAVRDHNLSALLGAHDGLQSVQRNPNDTGGTE